MRQVPWIRDIACNMRGCRNQGSQGNIQEIEGGREKMQAKGKGRA